MPGGIAIAATALSGYRGLGTQRLTAGRSACGTLLATTGLRDNGLHGQHHSASGVSERRRNPPPADGPRCVRPSVSARTSSCQVLTGRPTRSGLR